MRMSLKSVFGSGALVLVLAISAGPSSAQALAADAAASAAPTHAPVQILNRRIAEYRAPFWASALPSGRAAPISI